MFSIKSHIINNLGFAGCIWSLSHILLLLFIFTVLYSVFKKSTKLCEIVKDREAWCAAVHWVTKIGHNLVTEQQ